MSRTDGLADAYVCADGTEYAVHSELVRGEGRYYWVMRHNEGDAISGSGGAQHVDADGSTDKRAMQRLARRLAIAHNKRSESVRMTGTEGAR